VRALDLYLNVQPEYCVCASSRGTFNTINELEAILKRPIILKMLSYDKLLYISALQLRVQLVL
jgi:hypothetical protein